MHLDESNLFNYLLRDIEDLDIYQKLFNSTKPEYTYGGFLLKSPEEGITVYISQSLSLSQKLVKSIIIHYNGKKYCKYIGLSDKLSFNFSKEKVDKIFQENIEGYKLISSLEWAGIRDTYSVPCDSSSHNNFLEIIYNENRENIAGIILKIEDKNTDSPSKFTNG